MLCRKLFKILFDRRCSQATAEASTSQLIPLQPQVQAPLKSLKLLLKHSMAALRFNPVSLMPSVLRASGLLSVKRIQDPELKTRDVVNVQFRIRRLADQVGGQNIISPGQTTARNPDTSETYKPVDFQSLHKCCWLQSTQRCLGGCICLVEGYQRVLIL